MALDGPISSESPQEMEESPEFIVPQTRIFKYFWDGIAGREYQLPTKDELKTLFDQELEKNSPPMQELTAEEYSTVYNNSLDQFSQCTTGESRVEIIEAFANTDQIYYTQFERRIEFIFAPSKEIIRKLASNSQLKVMGRAKALEIISTPEGWNSAYVMIGDERGGGFGHNLPMQGMRTLDGYGISHEQLAKSFAGIRQRTGQAELNVLDIGGGMGVALDEIKSLDPNARTINLTVDLEPIMYPVDELVLCPAELLPRRLEESADYIVSRTAFRYFNYPDLALRNAVMALSIGGEADILYSFERSERLEKLIPVKNAEGEQKLEGIWDDLVERTLGGFRWIKELESKGYIRTNLPEPPNTESDRETKRHFCFRGYRIRIEKLKSLHLQKE